MMKRCIETTQRAKAGFRLVSNAIEARLIAAAYDYRVALPGERACHIVDQPFALIAGVRLVAAEAARAPTGKDGAQYFQSNASVACPSAL